MRGSCYQDYIFKNKDKNLKINLLGKNFIENDQILPLSTYPNNHILGSNENGYWPIFFQTDMDLIIMTKSIKRKNHEIIFIGDSFAQNATVNYEKSIQGILK